MKLAHALLLTIPLCAVAATHSNEAAACGGCAVPVGEDTQVTGHRMLLSVSKTETTLWDQIEYSGNPKDFAWILPIKAEVDIGLSSDVLFAQLSTLTATTVAAPPLNCPPPPACWGWDGEADGGFGSSSAAGGASPGGVDVIAREVIGPYDTVQLMSQDPMALKNWLTSHNYNIPAEVAPIIDAYVQEGFGFLALRLNGEDVNAMRPVRITLPGAGMTLPLRMVGVGTGAFTPITLWIMGEGRYEPTNFPWFTIEQKDIVWNWDTSDSNYAQLRGDGFKQAENGNWLIQYSKPFSQWSLRSTLEQVVSFLPEQSGYGDPADGYTKAFEELDADMAKVFGGINESSLWLTRMNADLARKALGQDLTLGAAASQTEISNFYQATKTTGTPPTCPVWDPCPPDTNNPGGDNGGGWWDDFGDGNPNNGSPSSASCAIRGETNGAAALFFMGLGLGVSISRRRRASRADKR
jgi:hypothetical protein